MFISRLYKAFLQSTFLPSRQGRSFFPIDEKTNQPRRDAHGKTPPSDNILPPTRNSVYYKSQILTELPTKLVVKKKMQLNASLLTDWGES